MIVYNDEDREITIPNGIGNIDINITQADLTGYATEEWVENNFASNSDVDDEIGKLENSLQLQIDSKQPNWGADRFESGYIQNRTHYVYGEKESISVNVTNTRAGETLIGGLSAGNIVRIENVTDENANSMPLYVYMNRGDRFTLPLNGPSVDCAIVIVDNALAIVQNKDSYGIDNVLQFDVYTGIKRLDDFYLSPNVAFKSDLNEQLNTKQNTLVSGENIKTINGESIVGDGNLSIKGGNVVELTQEEFDNITPEANTIYVITDAEGVDINNYATQKYVDNKLGDIETILDNIIGQ